MRLAAAKPPPFRQTARRAVWRAAPPLQFSQAWFSRRFTEQKNISNIAKAAALGNFANAAAFNLPCSLAISETPPFARAAQSAHLRGVPHSALPNAAGGGEAAALSPDRPQGGLARRASSPIFASVVFAAFHRTEKYCRHCKSRRVRLFR